YEKVSVIPVAAAKTSAPDPNVELTSFLGIWMLPASAGKAKWIFGILLFAVLGLAGGLGYLFWQKKRRRVYPLVPVGPAK
ncbi:MAG: type III secretion system inner membrane ring lipoprotein SctJ, partial [Phyllobacterium sp.]